MGYVYITTNTVNGKRYIGQTTKGEDAGYIGSGLILKRAVKKYGEENFTVEILAQADTKNELDTLERRYILEYDAINSKEFYNIASGGQGGNLGPKVNKLISEAVSGEKNGMYGKKLSPESIAKIQRTFIEKYGQHPLKGRPRTQKDRNKISKSTKDAMVNPELRQHLSEKRKEWWQLMTDDERTDFLQRKGDANKAFWDSVEGQKQKKERSERMRNDNHFKGKHHKIVTCPHCGKAGGEPGMIRWHFENCKQRNEQ